MLQGEDESLSTDVNTAVPFKGQQQKHAGNMQDDILSQIINRFFKFIF